MLNALAKLEKEWLKNLPLMVWADRITTRASTEYAPYRLVFGQDCVLPVELKAASWEVIAWERVRTLEDLLVARARQLERMEKDILTVQESIRRRRLKNKAQIDKVHHRRKGVLKVGDMDLLHNTVLDKQWSKKLDNHWLGSYLIKEAQLDLGTYLLSELDGAKLNGVYAGNRLKKSFQREGIELDAAEDAADNGDAADNEDAADNGIEEEVEGETDNQQDD